MPLVARSTCDLGLVAYDEAFATQCRYAERRAAGEIGDTLLLCEHPPVYTLGTNATKADVLDRTRAPVVQSDRGGEATYHGPGQVVGYVIADLEARGRDLHAYCRDLEEIMLRALADFGLQGRRIDGLTGVWLGPDKVGALGVRVRRWISTHGFALNVGCDLSYFDGIIPCGISDRGVTSMEQALSRDVDLARVKESCARAFEDIFQA
jgi:lipoate-protein ligase B